MIKMLIAEDNILALKYLTDAIDWQSYDINITGSVQNGREALELIHQDPPDILLTDIRMPIMDGLVLSKAVREKYPHIKIVILSAFGEFEYAQKALKIGVSDYVMKPFEDEALLEAITKAKELVIEDNRRKEEEIYIKQKIEASYLIVQREVVFNLLNGLYNTKDQLQHDLELLNYRFPYSHFCVCSFEADDSSNQANHFTNILSSFRFCLEDLCKQYLSNSSKADFSLIDQKFVLLVNGSHDFFAVNFQHILVEIQNELVRRTQISSSIGVSNISNNPLIIHLLYQQASKALFHKFYIGEQSIVRYSEISLTSQDLIYPVKYENQIISYASSGLVEETEKAVKVFFDLIKAKKPSVYYAKSIVLGLISKAITNIYELELDQYKDVCISDEIFEKILLATRLDQILKYAEAFFKNIVFCVSDSDANKSDLAIQKAIGFIKANYTKDISVESVAKEVNLNPNYFSHLFSKVAGKTFSQYLTEIRINKAKELLAVQKISATSISEMVGFKDPIYFGRVFKKLVGQTLSEYRQSNSSSKEPS